MPPVRGRKLAKAGKPRASTPSFGFRHGSRARTAVGTENTQGLRFLEVKHIPPVHNSIVRERECDCASENQQEYPRHIRRLVLD